jgi:hypothetical protein
MIVHTREYLVASRALELFEDLASSMQQQSGRTLLGTPRYIFRARFCPDVYRDDTQCSASYKGCIVLEGKGRGLAQHYRPGTDERRLGDHTFRRVCTLRLQPPLEEFEVEANGHSYEMHLLETVANCLLVAPLLLPVTFREDIRRFMRDYFNGNDTIRFFLESSQRDDFTNLQLRRRIR